MATRNKSRHKREKLAVALLESPSIAEASRRVGIAERTAYAWLKDPEFQELFAEVKRRFLSLSLSRLETLTDEAINTLREIMTTGQGESPRVTASRTILEMVLKLYEYEQLEERIARLEARINGPERTY
jgi:transposase